MNPPDAETIREALIRAQPTKSQRRTMFEDALAALERLSAKAAAKAEAERERDALIKALNEANALDARLIAERDAALAEAEIRAAESATLQAEAINARAEAAAAMETLRKIRESLRHTGAELAEDVNAMRARPVWNVVDEIDALLADRSESVREVMAKVKALERIKAGDAWMLTNNMTGAEAVDVIVAEERSKLEEARGE